MKAEKAKDPQGHPTLVRFHGFSAAGITLAEFTKIVQSLHPIRDEKSATPAAAHTSALKIHPKVFNMIDCWISDSESPVVTEINLDAVVNIEKRNIRRDGKPVTIRVLRVSSYNQK